MTLQGKRQTGKGFTLVELVIVVLVLGIIAAAAAPKLFNVAYDSRVNATRHSLVVLRNSLELHRADNGGYPSAANITTALLPYLQGPFPAVQVGSNQNANVVATSQDPITTATAGGAGWAYNPTTGEIRINQAYFTNF